MPIAWAPVSPSLWLVNCVERMTFVLEFDPTHPYYDPMHHYVKDVLDDLGLDTVVHDLSGRHLLFITASPSRLWDEYERQSRLGIGLFRGSDPTDPVPSIPPGEKDEDPEWVLRSGRVLPPSARLLLLRSVIESAEVAEGDMEFGTKSKRRYGGMLPPLAESGLGLYEPVVTTLVHASHSLITQFVPLHDKKPRAAMWASVLSSSFATPTRVVAYFGHETAFALDWYLFYTYSLLPLGALGALVATVGVGKGIYALALTLWAIVFSGLWTRRQAGDAHSWGSFDVGEDDELGEESDLRPEFEGEMDVSPITGRLVKTYPSWKRQVAYLVSIPVTLGMLCVSVAVMVCGLNATAAIQPESILFVPALNGRGEAGRGLAGPDDHWVVALLPGIGYAVIVLVVNEVYSRIAVALTNYENHKTAGKYQASLILKQVPFQLFNSLLGLFYLAFFECNIPELSNQLRDLFMTDLARRVGVNCVLPYLLKQYALFKGEDQEVVEIDQAPASAFDDWTEVVTQFGYVLFFSSAFPLAPALAAAGNFVEFRAIVFRYAFLAQRPEPTPTRSIGIWGPILDVLCLAAISTNVALFAYSTDQASHLLAALGISLSDLGHLVLLFAVEHVGLAAKTVWDWILPPVPEWVRIDRAKRRFAALQALRARERNTDDTDHIPHVFADQ